MPRPPSQARLGRRLMWWPPWSLTRWQAPRVWFGANEWCQRSICFTVPPFGCLVVFWERRLRTMPCDDDWALMSAEQRADYMPCGCLHGGKVREGAHDHVADGLCGELMVSGWEA